MIDPFGRTIRYLRLSVTDRCDLRCLYCMAEDPEFLPKADLLSLEELDRLAQGFIDLGVKKIRLTGGEPLVRRGIMGLVRSLGLRLAKGELDELTLTTNGTQLAKYAQGLADAGMRRINVSLDSRIPDTFRRLTRLGRLDQVLAGLEAAKQAGLKVKVNMVALRGENEHEMDEMLTWCGAQGFDLCLIETMPLGDIDGDRTLQYLPLDEVRRRLESRWTLQPTDYATGGPARYVTVAETGRKLGFITPMTHGFCESCNRLRVTCTGKLYMCLGQEDSADLRGVLRRSEGPKALLDAIVAAVARKPKGHDFIIDRNQPKLSRHMNVTGG
ncbi:MAG TPA: GTP 3',8-cyclase MoaA [Candidatus Sulfotelmatobacter sp.]|nr:GTP 3',8-cyclase MoaA [Candidatus Sulfotelmatobacter sp.]